MKKLRLHITADKITAGKMLGRSKESDIVLAEDSIGELATILRHGYNETYREQLAGLFNSAFRRRRCIQ